MSSPSSTRINQKKKSPSSTQSTKNKKITLQHALHMHLAPLIVPHLILAPQHAKEFVRRLPLETPRDRQRVLQAQVHLLANEHLQTLVARNDVLFFVQQENTSLSLHGASIPYNVSRIDAFRNLSLWVTHTFPTFTLSAKRLTKIDQDVFFLAQHAS